MDQNSGSGQAHTPVPQINPSVLSQTVFVVHEPKPHRYFLTSFK